MSPKRVLRERPPFSPELVAPTAGSPPEVRASMRTDDRRRAVDRRSLVAAYRMTDAAAKAAAFLLRSRSARGARLGEDLNETDLEEARYLTTLSDQTGGP
jgi:hypothetical protein